jgi:hypothetical protein
MNDYPMLRLIEKHGGWIAVLLTLLPIIAGIWLVSIGWPFWWLAIGLGCGVVVFVFIRSYVELVRVMIDMLLPK